MQRQTLYVPPHISRNKLKEPSTDAETVVHPVEGIQQIKHFDSGYDLLKGQKWSDVLPEDVLPED